jgi:glycerate dehydrogenase
MLIPIVLMSLARGTDPTASPAGGEQSARGEVDERVLARALREGRIAGAGVDVLSAEPPREENPLLAPDVPNLIVTPHVAWAGREAQQILADQLVDKIEAFVLRRKQ